MEERHPIALELNQALGVTFWVIETEKRVVARVHKDGSKVDFDGDFLTLTTLAAHRETSAEIKNDNGDGDGDASFTSSTYHVSALGLISVPGIPNDIFKVMTGLFILSLPLEECPYVRGGIEANLNLSVSAAESTSLPYNLSRLERGVDSF